MRINFPAAFRGLKRTPVLDEVFPHLGDEGLDQIVLALEIEIQCPLGHPGGCGDLVHGHGFRAALLQELPGRGQDLPGAKGGDDLFFSGFGGSLHFSTLVRFVAETTPGLSHETSK
jgi:hypothetical protein